MRWRTERHNLSDALAEKSKRCAVGSQQIKPETRSMSATHVVVEGTLKPDGSLELDSKLNLPPGRVQLIVQPLPELPKDDPFWQMMQRISAARTAAQLTPRGTEEVEAQRRALRADVEEDIEKARRLQEESGRLRRDAAKTPRENP
jgi:hypothetical protein